MQVKFVLSTGGSATIELDDSMFAVVYNEALVHQVVTAYLAGGRCGTKSRKSRADVRGGGRKPWRQKGLGRARAGTIRSPIWRGGGAAFAARPHNYTQKVNRKMYRGAMRSILSELMRQDRIVLVENILVSLPKTKLMASRLSELGLGDVLIVTNERSDTLELASRNIPNVAVQDCAKVNPVSLVKFDKILMTVGAVKQLEARFR